MNIGSVFRKNCLIGIGLFASTIACDGPAFAADGTDVRISAPDFELFGVDASPASGTILISALGGIYDGTVTESRPLPGTVFDIEPRYSPDGRRIALIGTPQGGATSGRMQLFVVDLGTSRRTQISRDTLNDDDLVRGGKWPEEIIRSTDLPDDWRKQSPIRFPVWSRLGTSIYASVLRSDGADVIRKYSLSGETFVDFMIAAYEGFDTCATEDCFYVAGLMGIERVAPDGRRELVYAAAVGERVFRPRLSPDAATLVFVRERDGVGEFVALRLSDRTSIVIAQVRRSAPERSQLARSIGGYSAFGFSKDGEGIVFAKDGRIAFARLDGTASAARPIDTILRVAYPEAPRSVIGDLLGSRHARSLNNTSWSPDGSVSAFSALGKIWLNQRGRVRRLTSSVDREYSPAFSTDGRKILFVSWTDEEQGEIVEKDLHTGVTRILSSVRGRYYSARYVPNSKSIVYLRPLTRQTEDPIEPFDGIFGIFNLDLDTKVETHLSDWGPLTDSAAGALYPSVQPTRDGRVFFDRFVNASHGSEAYFALVSIEPNGSQKVWLKLDPKTSRIVVSPNGGYGAAFRDGAVEIYDLSLGSNSEPVAQAGDASAYFSQWLNNEELAWSFADSLSRWRPFSSRRPTQARVRLTYQPDRSDEPVVLANARIITMSGGKVIDRGFIVVKGGRIAYAGTALPVKYRRLRSVDLRGCTILPGYIDAHAHTHQQRSQDVSLLPRHKWGYYASLAAGVTSIFDPSADDQAVFAQAELVDSGEMLGPRIFSTGKIVGGDNFRGRKDYLYQQIPSLSVARRILRERRNLGATMAKSYMLNEPNRRRLLDAARSDGVGVTVEGNSVGNIDNHRMLIEGHTVIEHEPKIGLYSDWIELLGKARAQVTLTVGGDPGYDLKFLIPDQAIQVLVGENRFRKFLPPGELNAMKRVLEIGNTAGVTQGERLAFWRRLASAGVSISIGAHSSSSERLHFGMWMLAKAGFTPMQVLEAATASGARKLGLESQLGSIEKGKVADLVVLNGNPLDDILKTRDIRYVMKSGMLYDSKTLQKIYPTLGQCYAFPWFTGDRNKDCLTAAGHRDQ